MRICLRRREFIAGLGGAAAWPLAARAQQGDRVRRIGVLLPGDENDPVRKSYVSAFTQGLADLGWADGRNVRMDLRWHGDDTNRIRAFAQELVGLQPDIILTSGAAATAAVQRETRTIPIVFASVADPVASGIVDRILRGAKPAELAAPRKIPPLSEGLHSVKSRCPCTEAPDSQKTNRLKPGLMCCRQLMATFVANQRQARKNLTRLRRKTPIDHIESGTEEI